jgi:hypothetical protein
MSAIIGVPLKKLARQTLFSLDLYWSRRRKIIAPRRTFLRFITLPLGGVSYGDANNTNRTYGGMY